MPGPAASLLDPTPLQAYGPPELRFGENPAAGADFEQAVLAGYWTRLLSVHVRLVTSADVADRGVVVEYRDTQDQRYALYGAPVAQPASDTVDYVFSVWQPEASWEVDSSVLVPLGADLLYPGCDFRIHVANIDNTDQLSRIRFQWQRYYPPDAIGELQ